MAGDARGVKPLSLGADGAELKAGLARAKLREIGDLFDGLPASPGVRIALNASLLSILEPVQAAIRSYLGAEAEPVRAIAFDKADTSNWALGWHQDRTICVASKVELAGYGPWSIKQGLIHVEPPFEVIAGMITARIHLDMVDPANAPLKIALRSHRLGKVADEAADRVAERHAQTLCLAKAGDVWLYSTPILHGSDRAEPGRRRRVLQVDFSAYALPPPLEWVTDYFSNSNGNADG